MTFAPPCQDKAMFNLKKSTGPFEPCLKITNDYITKLDNATESLDTESRTTSLHGFLPVLHALPQVTQHRFVTGLEGMNRLKKKVNVRLIRPLLHSIQHALCPHYALLVVCLGKWPVVVTCAVSLLQVHDRCIWPGLSQPGQVIITYCPRMHGAGMPNINTNYERYTC